MMLGVEGSRGQGVEGIISILDAGCSIMDCGLACLFLSELPTHLAGVK